MQPHHILILGEFQSGRGGARDVCEDLADQLEMRGHRVLRSSSRRGRVARMLSRIYTAIRHRRQYDVAQVDLFSGRAFIWAEAVCAALRIVRKPFVLTLHGGLLPDFAARHPKRVRRMLAAAKAVTAPSAFLLERMRPYRSDLQLLPNAMNTGTFPFRLRDRARPNIVWLRAFAEFYNPSLAPEVVARLREEVADVHLEMVGRDKGDGSLQRCRATADRLGVADRVALPGGIPKDEVPRRLSQGDIFLNTTNIDNTPLSVMEAMACGLCVVSTNVGGLPYLLEHETDALLVPPNDPEAMAAAVRRILFEPGLAERLSKNGRAKVERFDWSQIVPRWEALFTEITSGS